jgi:2-pyrone-4,6-dicarboxylate lactonase
MTDVETTPAPAVSSAAFVLPAGACDAHSHVFGPFAEFPPLQRSVYALPDASPDIHAAARQALGVTYGVLTQPAPYADDPGAMLSAIAGSHGALRAVAVATPEVTDETLAAWRSGGIVGLRFTEMRAPSGDRYPGSVPFDALEALAPRMREHGLHAQLWASSATFAEWLPKLTRLGLPIVLDHMGCPDTASGVKHPDFAAIVEAVATGNIWVKLVLARVSRQGPAYEDARPFHDALVAAAPERMLWGSDWPYVRMTPAPDASVMLGRFLDWVPDEATRRMILIDNPARLYGFPGEKR